MHPDFRQLLLRERTRQLERASRRPRTEPREPAPGQRSEAILLRLQTIQDAWAVRRLAALEGRPAPAGPCVLAEVSGTVIAALPLNGGAPISDPFAPTRHLVQLLELRARQLAARR
jgi:hypothetical protein